MITHDIATKTFPDQEAFVNALFSVLKNAEKEAYIGEPVSQLAHGLQCAALAEKQGADDEVILGALLHDLGHLISPDAPRMDELGVIDHEHIAANALERHGFSTKVCALVRGHVQAKRYLCWKKPEYHARLSSASKGTLAWQGGPMSSEEAHEFEVSGLLKEILQVRAWDEQAKVKDLEVPSLEHYRSMALHHLRVHAEPRQINHKLSQAELEHFKTHGYVHIANPFNKAQLNTLRTWTKDLCDWPETPGKWMKYFEDSETESRLLCRVENFVPFHQGFADLIRGTSTMSLLEQLMDEPASLFKEKINVKLPGGAGFGAHQDAPAFVSFGQTYHITMMISVDDSTKTNGCLEFSDPITNKETLPQGPGGVVRNDIETSLPWHPLETKAGDIVLFDSYVPHRSRANQSAGPRRALYITYNRASEGERRDEYFADKRKNFPPDCEREPGKTYDKNNSIYNVGNPIR